MKLNVPFHRAHKENECGPASLKTALDFLGEEYETDELAELARALPSGMTWTMGLAYAAKKLGFPTKVITLPSGASAHTDMEYYQKNGGDAGKTVLEQLKKDCADIGVDTFERNLLIHDLMQGINPYCIQIVLINWNIIKGRDGFCGHYLVLTGHEGMNVLVHNPGPENAQAYMSIPRELFVKAWESPGTDKDTIIISRRKKQAA